jgi:hypothetical protein
VIPLAAFFNRARIPARILSDEGFGAASLGSFPETSVGTPVAALQEGGVSLIDERISERDLAKTCKEAEGKNNDEAHFVSSLAAHAGFYCHDHSGAGWNSLRESTAVQLQLYDHGDSGSIIVASTLTSFSCRS